MSGEREVVRGSGYALAGARYRAVLGCWLDLGVGEVQSVIVFPDDVRVPYTVPTFGQGLRSSRTRNDAYGLAVHACLWGRIRIGDRLVTCFAR